MAEVDRNKAFERTVNFVMHADQLTEKWTRLLVTVESCLFVAAVALTLWTGSEVAILIVFVAAFFVAAIRLRTESLGSARCFETFPINFRK